MLSLKRKSNENRRPLSKAKRIQTDEVNELPALLDIFQFLESPDPAPYMDVCMESEYSDIFQACLSTDIYDGMRYKLFQYQRRSLFKMLKRELLPDLFLDPSYSPLHNASDASNSLSSSKRFRHPLLPYFQFARGFNEATNTWVYQHQSSPEVPVAAQNVSWYSDTRGGIICEDMGTGKTCECLALIVLTKRQMVQPPSEGELLPCVGTVASALLTDLCNTSTNSHSTAAHTPRLVPSLKFLAAKTALLSCAESLRVMHDDGVLPIAIWRQLEPYPLYYWVNPLSESRLRRGTSAEFALDISFKVYMSSSTIVVVPDNLVDQWVREKYKHVQDSGGLEMLKLDNSTNTMPEPQELIKYDLVLISVSRLSKEYIPIDSKIGELGHSCRCYSRGFEQCTCNRRRDAAAYRSPLLRVHWKRLIVDEGHIMSCRNTARSLIAAYLIAERRWVCTGTPTHNLVHATSAISADSQSLSTTTVDESNSNSSSVESPDHLPVSSSPSRRSATTRTYRMNVRESSSDFLQMGVLVSKFLRMDPFAQSTSAWTGIMVQPYKRGEPAALARLQALMQSIMVRNRPEAIGSDVQLPPLHEKAVVLPPTRHQALTYNTAIAFFHINAVLTERTGRDYFFHPDNKKHLRQIVDNLFLACFWFSISLNHIQDGIANGLRALELWEQGDKPYSDDDVDLLRKCIAELQRAANDPEWAYIVQADSVGYWVKGLPPRLAANLFCSPSDIAETDIATGVDNAVKLATLPQLRDGLVSVKRMLAVADDDLPPLSTNVSPTEFDRLRSATIVGCTSSKVAYLTEQLLYHQQQEKCIVFASCQSEVIIISDALRLARVPHLVYANQVMTQSQRRHNITTFSTSTMYNVIVMDVVLAAYGIDLSAASRVWFISPIWQAARERQAIKRAHRLGQQHPVFVETLITGESIEEALWRRRQEISDSDSEPISKDVEEDGKMRSVLSNASFIQRSSIGLFASGVPLLPPGIRYPQLLRRKYELWSPDSPNQVSSKVPFYKAKRLSLRLSSLNEVAPMDNQLDAPSLTQASL
ncbi:hypothetical protein GGH94_002353 [Coemansia aciculifera]|uniref:Helicase C-terminal domain-containing protein n=1 Tax=Coemansia aciculifera TaxID=417176 RepID=A0A9W8IJZ9_9FUNG|nr:hypothetical protein GGH94_002353 [Coemansia aciculifera]